MINQYVIEGKCITKPFTAVDDQGKLYVQINMESNDNLVYVRAYNTKLLNGILNDVHIKDNLIITGFVGSVLEAGELSTILNISKFTVV